MKKLVLASALMITFMNIGPTTATAEFLHPEDKDSVSKVGVGATFSASADINVKPGQVRVYFQNGHAIDGAAAGRTSACYLQIKEVSERDRRIPKDTVLTISRVIRSYVYSGGNDKYTRWTELLFASKNIESLVCNQYTAKDLVRKLPSEDLFEMTIGEMKAHITGFLQLNLATPQDITEY